MIRERRLNTIAFQAGGVTSVELPKDACYHQIQLALSGGLTFTYPANGGGSTDVNSQIAEGFPFNLISRARLIRNGSDVVWQGSGKQMAKESLMLNGMFPFARMWFDAASSAGTAYSVLTKSVNGITVPSNSEGIGCNEAVFTDTAAQSTANIIDFSCVLELWLQLGVDDNYFATLVDARPLASYALEITWEQIANVVVVGSVHSAAGVATISANLSIQSYDQDNLALGIAFGTFKRASFQVPGAAYSSSNLQQLLPRGNLYYGILMETLGYKSAGLSTIAQPGNDIVTEIQNRINSNYQLRDVFFQDLQAKNRNDGLVPSSPYAANDAGVKGWGFLYYPCTGDSIKELVATYTMDQFDLLLSTSASSGAGQGDTYTSTPVINLLTQEVIPGKSVASGAARGAFAGSLAATSAKPGA